MTVAPSCSRNQAPSVIPKGTNGFAIPGLRLAVLDQQFSRASTPLQRTIGNVETYLTATMQSQGKGRGATGI